MDGTTRKPPLGASPKDMWLERRARELARSIHEYVEGGYLGGPITHHIVRWTDELKEVLSMHSKADNNQQTEGT